VREGGVGEGSAGGGGGGGADLWVLGRHALDRGVIGEYDGSISVAAMRPVATITAATR